MYKKLEIASDENLTVMFKQKYCKTQKIKKSLVDTFNVR